MTFELNERDGTDGTGGMGAAGGMGGGGGTDGGGGMPIRGLDILTPEQAEEDERRLREYQADDAERRIREAYAPALAAARAQSELADREARADEAERRIREGTAPYVQQALAAQAAADRQRQIDEGQFEFDPTQMAGRPASAAVQYGSSETAPAAQRPGALPVEEGTGDADRGLGGWAPGTFGDPGRPAHVASVDPYAGSGAVSGIDSPPGATTAVAPGASVAVPSQPRNAADGTGPVAAPYEDPYWRAPAASGVGVPVGATQELDASGPSFAEALGQAALDAARAGASGFKTYVVDSPLNPGVWTSAFDQWATERLVAGANEAVGHREQTPPADNAAAGFAQGLNDRVATMNGWPIRAIEGVKKVVTGQGTFPREGQGPGALGRADGLLTLLGVLGDLDARFLVVNSLSPVARETLRGMGMDDRDAGLSGEILQALAPGGLRELLQHGWRDIFAPGSPMAKRIGGLLTVGGTATGAAIGGAQAAAAGGDATDVAAGTLEGGNLAAAGSSMVGSVVSGAGRGSGRPRVQARHPQDRHLHLSDELRSLIDPSHPQSPVQDTPTVWRRIDAAPRIPNTQIPVADPGGYVSHATNVHLANAPYLPEIARQDVRALSDLAAHVLPAHGFVVKNPTEVFVMTYHSAPGLHVPQRGIGTNPWLADSFSQRALELGYITDPQRRAINAAMYDIQTKIHELIHQANPALSDKEVEVQTAKIVNDKDPAVRRAMVRVMAERTAMYEQLFSVQRWREDVILLRDEYNRAIIERLKQRGITDPAQLPVDAMSLLWSDRP